MRRFQGLLNRTKSSSPVSKTLNGSNAPVDSPEENGPRAIRLFCESGSASNGGEEVLHLPVIVEAAESSPAAAASAAQQIRKFLGKEWQQKPHVQYNAIMLIRILSDNPGPTFTRNFDKSFVTAVKDTLRSCKDPSTQQILRETLDALEAERSNDEGLSKLLQMWLKEKGYQATISMAHRFPMNTPPQIMQQQHIVPANGFTQSGQNNRGSSRSRLPQPSELASRIEEARNTAKILRQLVQSTPTEELLDNELVREFAERCQAASRSMQTYINCDNPHPDHDTMQTLIETNEQLTVTTSQYQRAILAARRTLGVSPSPNEDAMVSGGNGYQAPTGSVQPPPSQIISHFSAAPPAQDLRSVSPPNSFHSSSQPRDSRATNLNQVPTTRINGYVGHGSYSPPPDQPKFQSMNYNGYQQPPVETPSNPFADPADHQEAAPMQNSETSYFRATTQSPPLPQQTTLSSSPPRLPEVSRTFSIEPEPVFAPNSSATFATSSSPPSHFPRRNTAELENAYSEPNSATAAANHNASSSPVLNHATPQPTYHNRSASQASSLAHHDSDSGYEVSPQASPMRSPPVIPVRTTATHPHDYAAEIDGSSRVGRGEEEQQAQQQTVSRSGTVSSYGAEPGVGTMESDISMYTISPVDGRVSTLGPNARPRVDVAGTGGLRGFTGST